MTLVKDFNLGLKSGREQGWIRIVVVDDYPLVCAGIKTLLERDSTLKVVGEATNCDDAIALISRLKPDVAILDIRLGQGSGIDVGKSIKKLTPTTRILVLTAYDNDEYIRALVRLGARGYLLKTVSAEELCRAVHTVAEGSLAFLPEIVNKVIRLMENRKEASLEAHSNRSLTARESEVLEHLGQGLRNYEIAEGLGISLKTVEAHIGHILLKLGVKSRTQAVVDAFKKRRLDGSPSELLR